MGVYDISASLVQEHMGRIGLSVSPLVADQVSVYTVLLRKWNERMNLTALSAPIEILQTLFAESFLGAELLQRDESPCLDVGSGAGFPGLAIKIYRPDLEMILMEPRLRKAAFLSAVKRELGLDGVEILSSKLEEIQIQDFKAQPTVLMSRGVRDPLNILVQGKHLLSGRRKVLLFTTRDQAKSVRSSLQGIEWDDPKTVPWNTRHILLLGRWSS
jgi:16S rRNA (guanine(527)-N(7))-methyltransferase RsmG